tara:strand:- start:961 stop:1377 length:417 start_codon:yes stop_codon:yes gene_type:complete
MKGRLLGAILGSVAFVFWPFLIWASFEHLPGWLGALSALSHAAVFVVLCFVALWLWLGAPAGGSPGTKSALDVEPGWKPESLSFVGHEQVSRGGLSNGEASMVDDLPGAASVTCSGTDNAKSGAGFKIVEEEKKEEAE